MTTATFGGELRRWRARRGISQLELAGLARTTQRHVSFVETGRSEPSRSMVLRLADALDVPVRERNGLLVAAGYAPVHPERRLDDAALVHVRGVLQRVLDAHGHLPAYVVDGGWEMVLSNPAAAALTAMLPDPMAAAEASGGNTLVLLLHPDGVARVLTNFDEVARVMLARLERSRRYAPDDRRLSALHERVLALPGVQDAVAGTPVAPSADDLAVGLRIDTGAVRLHLLTTIATIGAAHDVTLAELHLETLLPADAATDDVLRELSA